MNDQRRAKRDHWIEARRRSRLVLSALVGVLVLWGAATGSPAQLAGESWSWRNPLPQGNGLAAAVRSGSRVVACGRDGTILTSEDGISWTARESGTQAYLRSIAVDGQDMVAVGRDGKVVYSGDGGASWSLGDSGAGADFRQVLRFGTRWVAWGHDAIFFNAVVISSTDGANWTAATGLTELGAIVSMASSGTRAALVGYDKLGVSKTAYAEDGDTWHLIDVPAGAGYQLFRAIVWDGTRFLATGESSPEGAVAFFSADGSSWTRSLMTGVPPTSEPFGGLVWAGTQFVTAYSSTVYTSADGIAWAQASVGNGNESIEAVFSFPGGTFATSTSGEIHSSVDGGASWTRQTPGNPRDINAVAPNPAGGWVAVGADGAIFTSADAATWVSRGSEDLPDLRGAALHEGQWVAVGREIGADYTRTSELMLSDDGISWTRGTRPPGGGLYSIMRSGSHWVATGRFQVYTSPDLVTWTERTPQTPIPKIRAIASNGSRLVIAGGNEDDDDEAAEAVIEISDDNGVTWTQAYFADGRGRFLRALVWTGSQFVAVGDGGVVLASVDGSNGSWTSALLPTHFRGIAAADGLIVAVGGQFDFSGTVPTARRQVYTTPDGITWTERTVPVNSLLYAVIKTGGQWVACGYDGTMVTSPDAINWTARDTGTNHELYALHATADGLLPFGEAGTILSSSAGGLPGLGDTDLDGLVDLVEHYFGTPLDTPNGSPIEVFEAPDSVAILWPEISPAGLEVTVEWSPDLATWLASGESAGGIAARSIVISSPAAEVKQASVTGSLPVFLRLRVGVASR